MTKLHTALFNALDGLRASHDSAESLLELAMALYQAASEIDLTLPTAASTPIRASYEAFWRAQRDFAPLALNAGWSAGRRAEAVTESLLERMRAAVLDYSLANRGGDMKLALGAALTDLIDQHSQFAATSGLVPTPATVAALCAELLDVQEGMQVLDPAGGVGRSVVAIAYHLRDQGLDPANVQFDLQEVNTTAAALAQLHLLLNGISTARVWLADTLNERRFDLGHYDRVVTDPPFGMKMSHLNADKNDPRFLDIDIQRFKTRGEWLFLLTALAALKPGGHAIMITPPGTLFRGGVEEDLRKTLSRRGTLEGVISLPSSLYALSGIPLALLKFRRPVLGESPRTSIRLLNASSDATRIARQQTLLKAAREAILRDFQLDNTLTGRAITLSSEALTESGNWLPATHLPLPQPEYALPADYEQQLVTAQAHLTQAAKETEKAFAQLAKFARP